MGLVWTIFVIVCLLLAGKFLFNDLEGHSFFLGENYDKNLHCDSVAKAVH